MAEYLHHVPGRLRLRIRRLRGDRRATRLACDAAAEIPGVREASANAATGSLIIEYDRKRLTPTALWDALCAACLASGPSPLYDDGGVTRREVAAPDDSAALPLGDALAKRLLEMLLERSAVALLGALV
jgi:hypothetical protein